MESEKLISQLSISHDQLLPGCSLYEKEHGKVTFMLTKPCSVLIKV